MRANPLGVAYGAAKAGVIKATETLHMKIPLHFEGADVAPGVKTDGGILAHSMTELDITCLPKDLP